MEKARGNLVLRALISSLLVFVTALIWLGPSNLWSLQVLHARMGDGGEPGEPPAGHARAALWTAQDALGRGQPAQALSLLEDEVRQGEPLAVSVYAHGLAAQGRHREAIQYWSQAGDFNSLFSAAQALAEDGRTEEAELAYQAAYRIDPYHTVNLYADFLGVQRGHEVAESFLRNAISSFPGSNFAPQWQLRLGNSLRTQGRLVEAEEVFHQALSENPDTISLLIGLGWVYAYKGERDNAVEQFEQVMRLYPKEGEGYVEMGLLLRQEGRFDEADTWLEEAIRLEPESQSWHLIRGNIALEARNWFLAIEVFRELTRRFPQDGRGYAGLAWGLHQAGRQAEGAGGYRGGAEVAA